MIISIVLGTLLAAAVGSILGYHFGQVEVIRVMRGLIAENQISPAPDDVKAVRFNAYTDVLREIGK